jgi:hypothetical protein
MRVCFPSTGRDNPYGVLYAANAGNIGSKKVRNSNLVVWSIFTLVSECLPLLWLTGGKEVDAWIQCVYPVAVLVLLRRPNVRSYFDRTPFEAHSGGPSLSK